MDTRVAIVTAASKGIGAGIARKLAADGWKVVLLARSEAVHELAAELGGVGLRGDITNAADLERLCDLALATYGAVHGVAISTGHPAKGDILELDPALWHQGLDLTLMPLLTLSRLLMPQFERQGCGSVVSVSSSVAVEPHADFPISSPMRAALSNLTKLLARRYAATGVRFNSVLPGFVDNRDELAERVARIPQGRYGTVAELAAVAAFLLGDDASYVTGQNILVDGGMIPGT